MSTNRSMVISDASIARYRIVQGDTTNTTNAKEVGKAATAETQVPLGVTVYSTAAANRSVAVQREGVALVEVDGNTAAIDIGTPIVAMAGGKGRAAKTGGSGAQWVLGFALAPSEADGDIIPVQIARAYYPVAS